MAGIVIWTVVVWWGPIPNVNCISLTSVVGS
jgi:hypothetical protein